MPRWGKMRGAREGNSYKAQMEREQEKGERAFRWKQSLTLVEGEGVGRLGPTAKNDASQMSIVLRPRNPGLQ